MDSPVDIQIAVRPLKKIGKNGIMFYNHFRTAESLITIFFPLNFLFVLKSSETLKKILPSALFEGGGVCGSLSRTGLKNE